MEKLGINIEKLGRKLLELIPNLIALKFVPNDHPKVRSSQLEVIVDSIIDKVNTIDHNQ